MKGILFYPFFNQRSLVQCYAAKLRERGILIDYICVANGEYDASMNFSFAWYRRILFRLFLLIPSDTIKNHCIRAFAKYLFWPLVKLYDFADFHAYYPALYNYIMKKCSKAGVPYYIHLWGTDIMRATPKRIKRMRLGFDSCKSIVLTDSMVQIMRNYYGHQYDMKLRVSYFGNKDFETIDDLTEERCLQIKESLYPESDDKLIVVLGYNAHPAQHHDQLIEAISELPNEYKEKIYLSIPLTYGAPDGYCYKVRALLNTTNIAYRIFDSFLNNEEMATLRKTADIVLNIQDTDALAASLQDHLYCGGVCIIGNWLEYIPYDNNGVFYVKTTKEDLTHNLMEVIFHLDDYKNMCLHNHEVLKSILSWDSTIDNIVAIYGESYS